MNILGHLGVSGMLARAFSVHHLGCICGDIWGYLGASGGYLVVYGGL